MLVSDLEADIVIRGLPARSVYGADIPPYLRKAV
jgi:hypothetical protein